jgi:hypothetical protein
MTLFGDSLFRCDQVKMSSYWISLGPNPMTGHSDMSLGVPQ